MKEHLLLKIIKGKEVFGKTLGVIGTGDIGSKVARIGKGFDMRVLGINESGSQIDGIEMVNLETLLKESDVISVSVPLTDETKDTIDKKEIVFDELVEEHLIQPTFITDMPRETTSLCKLHRENPDLIERFECFANASEICNAYTELNNPILQRQFLEEQVARQEQGDEEAHPMDDNFIQAMEYGMPPTGGIGIGIDRLNMLMTNQVNIREVQSFGIQRS